MLGAFRKDDAVLAVCQNNLTKTVEVVDLSARAEELCGYPRKELAGMSLSILLPQKLRDRLDEDIEYDDATDARDLADVLGKIADFSVVTRKGESVPCRLRIVRGESRDGNPWFNLVLHHLADLRRASALQDALSENFKGHEIPDSSTGLPNRDSLLKDLELVRYHSNQGKLEACVALMRLDGYEALEKKYGTENARNLHRQAGALCCKELRTHDVVGTVAADMLGLLLINISQESSRLVLNRLRWAVGNTALQVNDGEPIKVSVSIGFLPITKDSDFPDDLLSLCEERFAASVHGGAGVLVALDEAAL